MPFVLGNSVAVDIGLLLHAASKQQLSIVKQTTKILVMYFRIQEIILVALAENFISIHFLDFSFLSRTENEL